MKGALLVASVALVTLVAFASVALLMKSDEPERRPNATNASVPQPPPAPPPPAALPLAYVDKVLKKLPVANIAFNHPTTLGLNDSTEIQLLLALKQPISVLKEQLTEVGSAQGAQIKVSDQVEARLTGIGFRIEAITPEARALSQDDTAEWRWEIEATETGTQELHLTVSALVVVDGERTPAAIRTFDRTIEVNVTLGQRVVGLVTDLQRAWAALLVPLGGLIGGLAWRRWKRRRLRDEEQYGWSDET